jgi:hypothetical protein
VSVYPPLAIEIAIPLLLISRRTRWLGIVVTAGFHFTLGLSAFYRFGAMVFALLFLFLPGNTVDLARRWWVNSSLVHHAITLVEPAKLRVAYLWATRAFLVIAIGVLLSQASWSPRRPWFRLLQPLELPPRSILSHGFQLVWLVVVPALFTIWMLAMRAGKPGWRSGAELLRPYHAIYAIPLALVVLNGALPYLGLKTETSFSMFSNLRTEGGSSNHLIVRRPLRLGTYQDDLVAIVASSDPELRRVAEAGFRLPYFEFRSYLSRKLRAGVPDLEVTYRRGGAERSIRFPLDDPALSRPDPWLPRKLLYFRPVAPEDRGVCQH